MPDVTITYVDADGTHVVSLPIGDVPADGTPVSALIELDSAGFLDSDTGAIALPYDDASIAVTAGAVSVDPGTESVQEATLLANDTPPDTSVTPDATPAPSDVTE